MNRQQWLDDAEIHRKSADGMADKARNHAGMREEASYRFFERQERDMVAFCLAKAEECEK
jgi:hypothetical protein